MFHKFGSQSSKKTVQVVAERELLERTLSTPQGNTQGQLVDPGGSRQTPQISRNLTTDGTFYFSQNDPRSLSPGRQKDPLGLHIVYDPKENRRLDIIFVHGLGGTSRLSWSKNKDLGKFWPRTFLPFEPDICHGRILTFGYDANIMCDVSNKSASVLDFAKELLFELKYATTQDKTEELNIGAVPIIFVVHSMGGLIVKEAYLQGQNDPDYESIIRAIDSILFLSTPHRGTHLADVLNRILQASFVSTSKQFIADITKNSFMLQKLNDQFRHVAPKLNIVSFYETQMTPVGLSRNKIMVLEKESSILGYPGEVSKALAADHHGVCKYDSSQDPIYITVRNILKSLVRKLPVPGITTSEPPTPAEDETFDLEHLLGIPDSPDTDYIFFRDRWTQGTCQWILNNETFLAWMHNEATDPRILWLHGSAGSGKSVIASFIINQLFDYKKSCQYFFIRFGDSNKRLTSTLLKSLVLQIAGAVPEFRQRLAHIRDEIAKMKTADAPNIWQKLFKSVLFKLKLSAPLYWVIDGLEESDTPRTTLKLLADVSSASIPLRVLIISRKTQELTSAFQKAFVNAEVNVVANEGHQHDFGYFIESELNITNDLKFKDDVAGEILRGAKGNFLWVHLAIQKINKCITKAEVKQALKHLPPGMEALYDRMAQSVAELPDHTNRKRASDILAWVTCALRILTVEEIFQALETKDEEIIDLPKSVEDLCGGFVVVDNDGHVAMIHQTAREYLLGDQLRHYNINRRDAHEKLFDRCMGILTETGLRAKINRGQASILLDYAASSWFRHLCMGSPLSPPSLSNLMQFLRGSSVLVWIQFLASREQLRLLISASTYLATFADKIRRLNLNIAPSDRAIPECELVESWSIDLVKVVGKFGANLTQNPEAIHRFIPPFCPQESVLYKQYGRREGKTLKVGGFSNTSWDDSLTRLSFGSESHVEKVVAIGAHIAVLSLTGCVVIYRDNTFEEIHRLDHGERVPMMQINTLGTLLATYGSSTTKVWNISNGNCVSTARNPGRRARPKSMMFAEDDTVILLGSDDGHIRKLSLETIAAEWEVIAKVDEQQMEGTFVNSPSCMAISPDGTQVALGYRGYPASVWEIQGPSFVDHCSRSDADNAWGEVVQVTWHPYASQVFGLYLEGIVFKWHPYENYEPVQEIKTGGARLAINHDGKFFATGDATGNLKVYSSEDFCLVYHLAAQNPILDLAFSPDAYRLYDVRGSYGNVWEPSALIRLSEMTERSSDSASDAHSTVERPVGPEIWNGNVDAITVIAAHPQGRLYSLGTEDGNAELFDDTLGAVGELGRSQSYMSTEQMVWSPNGRYVAFADLSGRLYVKTYQPRTMPTEPWTIESKLQLPISNARGAVLQLLFHPDSASMFVYTKSLLTVVSLASQAVHVSQTLRPENPSLKWLCHPLDKEALLAIEPGTIHVYSWIDLSETRAFSITSPFEEQLEGLSLMSDSTLVANTNVSESQRLHKHSKPLNIWDARETVDRVLLTPAKNYILVQISSPLGKSRQRQKQIVLFEVAALSNGPNLSPYFRQVAMGPAADRSSSMSSLGSSNTTTRTINFITLPENLASEIEIPLSFLSRDRLVFLDRSFWVCTWRLPLPSNISGRRTSDIAAGGGTMTEIKQHYFLPGDWISPDCVALCTVMANGTVLMPRNGEIAVIKCAGMGK